MNIMYLVHHISLVILLAVIAVLWKKYDELKRELHHSQETKHTVTEPKGDNNHDHKKNDESNLEKDVMSSVWCFHAVKESICRFQNLCYNAFEDDFIIFGTNINVSKEIKISSSSVSDFSGHVFTVSNIPSESYLNFTVHWIKERGFIMSRFKSDNLMHVLHDDIIPMYHTFELLNVPKGNNSKYNLQLIFIDGWDPGEFQFLYESMSAFAPIYIKDFEANDDLICFSEVHIGLSRVTTWYQYGYLVPQSPLQHLQVSSFHIKSTVEYLLKQIDIENTSESTESEYIVLLSRKINRRIINERDFMMTISKQVGIKVIVASLETHSLKDLILLVRKSAGIIGIHGSLLILAAFLPPGSVLIELYPYAVNPQNYTPYKTLSNIPGLHIFYKAWTNPRKDNSVGHPDWPPELGGISHLDQEEQIYILEQTEVPEHLCCEDPSWLYHIYQDTVIDIDFVIDLIQVVLDEARLWRVTYLVNRVTSPDNVFYPASVKSLSCSVSRECINGRTLLELSWKPPWNLIHLNFSKLIYEVLVQKTNEEKHIMYIVSECHSQISKNILCENDYNVWVRAVLDDHMYGPLSYVDCYT